ncbi:MAG: YaaA family protein [Campylobacterota bacterium]|nr:YaaA family protein [Campylobacterota bacterium]
MKILLAPAETKYDGGEEISYQKENFKFEELFSIRDNIVKNYVNFIQNSTIEELSSWFGLKNLKECKKYSKNILEQPTTKAILRYTGVAFDALDYKQLSNEQQNYCDENIIIFSNLFGAVLASDLIPDYKYKQGANLPGIDTIKLYKENSKDILDNFIGEEVIDLRAGFYDKFYKPSMNTITCKFLKDGKVVSHWAKHYRGLLVNQLAINNIKTIDEFLNMQIDNLQIQEIVEKKNKREIVYNIIE